MPMPATYRRVILFFLVAYAFTWFGNLGNWLWPSAYWPAPMNPLGPLMAAPLVIWLTEGGAGVKAWLRRLGKFGAPVWVYASAFLIPLAIIGASMGLTAASGAAMRPLPEATALDFVIMVPVILLMGPGPEETTFRGYAMHQLQDEMSPLAAALWVGLGVLIWHTPLIVAGNLAWPWMICIVMVSIVYAWFYNAGGSVWPLVALHFTVNYFGSEFLGQVVSDPQTRIVYAIIHCLLYACWAGFIVWRYGPSLGRDPRRVLSPRAA